LEIAIPTEKGVLRFFFEDTGPESEVGIVLDKLDENEGDLVLGTVKFKELRHAAKAIVGL